MSFSPGGSLDGNSYEEYATPRSINDRPIDIRELVEEEQEDEGAEDILVEEEADKADAPLEPLGDVEDTKSAEEQTALHVEREYDEDYAQLDRGPSGSQSGPSPQVLPVSPTVRSPVSSLVGSDSIPDDTPSLQGSLLSPSGSVGPSTPRKSLGRVASGALQPFERRFEARPSIAGSPASRTGSPGFWSPHSRQVSISSRISQISSQARPNADETPEAPWEVMRWTQLRKITGQVFSEAGRRSFGRPTCLAVSALIAIGTSKGLILGFDYHQTLKIIIGQSTKATECGSITAIAIAGDYSTIAAGHANGHIFTWDISRPSQPFLRIPPLDGAVLHQDKESAGHLANCAVLHVGFLGTRHTALVSADSAGMAFSHLATRGLGPVTRTIKTVRLLGRYPPSDTPTERVRKPSSVLAFAPLPLGNVEQPTDGMGLTALLTPYLLVVVSTTPNARTQHKVTRPKEITPHSTLSGCLAWFPAVKLKRPGSGPNKAVSDAKLVYCWSNILTVLDVKVLEHDEPTDPNKPPHLEFQARNRWRAEEAIVAVQWLGRSVMGVLTISQRLLIVEDESLQVTDSVDLLQRQIYHQDLFSEQLKSVVEHLSTAEPSLHGVVADAFYMSFRAYKGRTFLLGRDDLSIGVLSNWADRLMALMESGDQVAAMRLAIDYYTGGASKVSVGLPESSEVRHSMVQERLVAMIAASLDYTFSQYDPGRKQRLQELTIAVFDACVTMQETNYLFATVFELFEDAEEESIFILTLEPYILDDEIKNIPPDVVKSLVAELISENQAARLEELLCRLEPPSFDLDEITMLCKQHFLYDALVHVWTQGIGDFITPLIEFMTIIRILQDGGVQEEDLINNPFYSAAVKVFPYLAYSLTGRRYPGGTLMDEGTASTAKASLYEYLFSGRAKAWPEGSGRVFRTTNGSQKEPAFPYLVLLLRFDTASFMSMLNEAFEDSFLNSEYDEQGINGHATKAVGSRPGYDMKRDHILSILIDTLKQEEFGPDNIIYLDMFIARNLPKFPDEIVLPGSVLAKVLDELCHPPSEELRKDCELSIEYLLSVYQPTNTSELLQALREVRFFRVLKSVYSRSRMFPELLEAYFEDEDDKHEVFDCIGFCLRPSSALSGGQIQSVKEIISSHIADLVQIDTISTARTLARHTPDLFQYSIDAIEEPHTRFTFLRVLLEPKLLRTSQASQISASTFGDRGIFAERYVQLMCTFDPLHVADYVGLLDTGDLRLNEVLPVMESSDVIDAAVVLLTRDGLTSDAMRRLITHMKRLQRTLTDLINAAADGPDSQSIEGAAQGLLEDIEKYTKIGIWLCQGQSANAERRARPRTNFAWDIKEDDLDPDEHLWLDLLDAVVQIAKFTADALRRLNEQPHEPELEAPDFSKLSSSLRTNVQQTFTALLTATATATSTAITAKDKPTRAGSQDHLSFLRVLRAFLTRIATSAPSLSDLRAVLSDIFSAYRYEEGVLSLANELLGSDVFTDIDEASQLRERGWRPRTQVCELCKRRAWGQGVGEAVWDEFVAKEQQRDAEKARRVLECSGGEEARRLDRGKGKAVAKETGHSENDIARRLTLVVFSCRHVFHRVCLDADFRNGRPPKQEKYKCPLCIESQPSD